VTVDQPSFEALGKHMEHLSLNFHASNGLSQRKKPGLYQDRAWQRLLKT